MLEAATIGLFCAVLLACLACGAPTVAALAVGVALFAGYGLVRHVPASNMAKSALGSVRDASPILVAFVLIGMLTALWRASGTIAFIVSEASSLVNAATVLPLSFLLCSGMSMLTGSSFASAATMGSICMALGQSMGVSDVLLGGAILGGVYVGDRCSPLSTSALLVAQLTKTELMDNIRAMLASGAVPFAASCAIYAALVAFGTTSGNGGGALDVTSIFAREFDLGWVAVLPAVLVVALAVAKVNVRAVMGAGIISAAALCMLVQGMEATGLVRTAIFGFAANDPQVAVLLDGGGIASMVNVGAIVCISSSYAGIFAQTHMLDGARSGIYALAEKLGPFAATVIASIAACVVACNQTLATMLVHQLTSGLHDGSSANSASALDLEDSVIVIAPLVPWSIAGSVPLATVGAPLAGISAACFLYLLPLWRLLKEGKPHRA